ncbi:MAG: hypothetical protein AAF125_06155, partial [Chloroflexota bacterium]
YLRRVGLQHTIVRAPLIYARGQPRSFTYRIVNLVALLPLLFQRSAPMPSDVFARGVARVATAPGARRLFYARDLWRLNTRPERRGSPLERPAESPTIEEPPLSEEDTRPNRTLT